LIIGDSYENTKDKETAHRFYIGAGINPYAGGFSARNHIGGRITTI